MREVLRKLIERDEAVIVYDDGTHWRINRQGVVQGCAPLSRQVIGWLVEQRLLILAPNLWPNGIALLRPQVSP